MDGLTLCEKLPTILPAQYANERELGSSEDQIKGLELGADDYVVARTILPC